MFRTGVCGGATSASAPTAEPWRTGDSSRGGNGFSIALGDRRRIPLSRDARKLGKQWTRIRLARVSPVRAPFDHPMAHPHLLRRFVRWCLLFFVMVGARLAAAGEAIDH